MRFIISILIGALSGWLAGQIMKVKGGFLFNVILGIVGSLVGSFLAGLIGLGATGWLGNIILSAAGACVLIWLVRKISKK